MRNKKLLLIVFVGLAGLFIAGCSGMDSTTREDDKTQNPDSNYVFDIQDDELTKPEIETTDPEEKNDSLLTFLRNSSKDAKTGYAVQVGAFSSENNAKKHIETSEKLLKKKLRTFYSDEVKLWVVQLLPFTKVTEAHQVKRSIRKKKEFKDAFVVKVIE